MSTPENEAYPVTVSMLREAAGVLLRTTGEVVFPSPCVDKHTLETLLEGGALSHSDLGSLVYYIADMIE